MSGDEYGTEEAPPRRRESWSIKTIVEEVSGRPIAELQDPERPVHPYLKGRLGSTASSSSNLHPVRIPPREGADDPIDRVYPPLVGATGRSLHPPEHHHHAETLARHDTAAEPSPGVPVHPPGPSRRPERIYLHYLLLHLDRLGDPALHYLQHAVDEEVAHREHPRDSPSAALSTAHLQAEPPAPPVEAPTAPVTAPPAPPPAA